MKKTVFLIVFLVILLFEQFLQNPTDTTLLYPGKTPEEISAITASVVRDYYANASSGVDELFSRFNGRRSPGAAVAVIQNGRFLHKKGYGMADLRSRRRNEPETCFMLASVTKTFTSMAVMTLKEEGRLSYDDTLPIYFPGVPQGWSNITVKHLLTHTSGIPDRFWLIGYGEGFLNRDILNRLIQHRALDFKPGSKHKYSNSGYNLLAMIIEKVSGKPFRTFLKERIFDPLGMHNTVVYDHTKPDVDNRAIAYKRRGRGYRPNDFLLYTTGASGIFSNVEDLYRWDQSLYTEQLVSKETIEEAFYPHTRAFYREWYGYGWRLACDGEIDAVFHTGSLGGASTIFFRVPEKQFTVIILSNAGIQTIRRLTRNITELYHPGLINRIQF